MNDEEHVLPTETERKNEFEVKIDNRVGVSENQIQTAIIVARLVAKKLFTPNQLKDPVEIIFAERIMDKGIACTHHGEAFPDGRRIAFAMDASSMKNWQRVLGPIATIILVTAHEMTHIAQIRRGNPPPSSAETIKNKGIAAYMEDPHEIEAHKEAFDLFKALRPHAKGTLQIGGKDYTIPDKSTYDIDLSRIPDFIKS